ncbi:MAG TPA: cytochrome C biosynthesis protein [Deltaproteobacteria bacterium]|nr:cytochrome C biosynthesis protein [Deltaproteobacteria bacterium]
MLQTFFITINEWLTAGTAIAAVAAFLWGMVSVMLSPCHLASIPLIIAYVGGMEREVKPSLAATYSVAFTTGLFITIALVGVICAMLGRMLGDVGGFWMVLVGGILIWIALGMLGVEKCSMPGGLLHRLNFRGILGAFGLGLAYGVLSGTCTFGFIAPILAIITIQEKIMTGVVMILLFAAGHCLPIMVAGSSTAMVKRLLENSAWSSSAMLFKKGAGAIILLLGLYFVGKPFIGV